VGGALHIWASERLSSACGVSSQCLWNRLDADNFGALPMVQGPGHDRYHPNITAEVNDRRIPAHCFLQTVACPHPSARGLGLNLPSPIERAKMEGEPARSTGWRTQSQNFPEVEHVLGGGRWALRPLSIELNIDGGGVLQDCKEPVLAKLTPSPAHQVGWWKLAPQRRGGCDPLPHTVRLEAARQSIFPVSSAYAN
jgi:hypothetical protein